jgi:D-psicose/D-tagatose/L-ribulose 3-epimerase
MLKTAICNELFGTMDFQESCDLLAGHGFNGIEIAPFTLFGNVTSIPKTTINMILKSLNNSGLEFAGLHWLFVKPENLHITSPDKKTREASWDHLKMLLTLAGELGGGYLTLGSPKQRMALDISVTEAWKYMEEGLESVAGTAADCNSTVCLEALASGDTNVINTLKESTELINRIDRDSISGMFDFHNCGDEKESWVELIRNYKDIIKHVHLNTPSGGHPLPEDSENYMESFSALKEINYNSWVSLEIFTIPEDPENILSETAAFLRRVLE